MAASDQLNRRLAFSKIDEPAKRALRRIAPTLEKAASNALDQFYVQAQAFEETARLFSGQAHVQKAKGAQMRHWARLARGELDETYMRDVRAIGEVHARIGLEPRWYIGGYALILEQFIRAVVMAQPKRSLLGGGGHDQEALADGLAALIKTALLDMDFSISTYLEAAETERRRHEEARLQAEARQDHVVEALAKGLERLASGALTYRIEEPFAAEYEKLRSDYNSAMQQMQDALQVIAAMTSTLRSGAAEIASAADDLSRRTEQQAASLEQTAAALDQITATVKTTAEGAIHAGKIVGEAKSDAERSGEVVHNAVLAMSGIERSSRQIGQIIGVIDEIAFQTNLLALNAGVEAARAGDAGRGFAVVASEVRALAQRSAEAAKEIKGLISASAQQVASGVSLVGETGTALERILVQVGEINAVVGEISASAREQASGLNQVNTAINQMDQVTQQNAAMVEQSTAASRALSNDSEELGRLVGRFEVGQIDTAPHRAAAKASKPVLVATSGGAVRSAQPARQPEPEPEPEEWQEF